MILTPTTFYAACGDGLVKLEGLEFQAAGRAFVAHQRRPPMNEWDKTYGVSDKELGFSLSEKVRDKDPVKLATIAKKALEGDARRWLDGEVKRATERRKTLKIIGE